MFRIHFYVDDRYLADVLRGVAGKARQLSVEPVVNAVAETTPRGRTRPNGAIKQDAEHTLGLFLKELKKVAPESPTSKDAKTALSKLGLSPTSNNHFMKRATDAGLLKKGKPPGKGNALVWEWV